MPETTLHRTLCLSLALALAACQGGNPSQSPPTKAAALPGAPVPAGMGTIKGTVKVDAAGGGILAAGGMNLRLLQAAANGGTVVARGDNDTKEAPIGPDGAFALVVQAGDYTLEATVSDGQGGVTKVVSPNVITVPLAQDPPIVDAASLVTRQTGSIQGLVELQDAPEGETPEGVDVFLSGGTSVVGKAGETGRFALTNVAEGTWNVVVAKPGYKRQVVKGVVVRAGRPTLLDASVVLERDAAPQAGVTGAVQSSDGKAILGAIVSVYPKDRQALAGADVGLESFTAVTDDQGRYALVNVPAGSYTLQVYRAFYQVPPRRSVTVVAGAPQDVGVTKLTSTVAYFGKVSGLVQDEAGNPLDGAVAQLDPPVTESQVTDATGRFTLDRILPGPYNLTVAAGGYKSVIVPVLVDNKPGFAVTLPDILRLGRGPVGADAPTVVFVPPAPPPATPEAPQGTPSPAAEPSELPTPTPPPAARIVATLAGNGEAGLADGVGGAARLNAPHGLELGPAGEALFVADEGNGRLRRVTLAGAVSTVGNAIQRPFGVALDATGGLYGLEFFSGVIKQLSPTGAFERFAGGSPKGSTDGPRLEARFSTLGDAVVAADGTMYVADTGNHRIRRITPGGVVSTLAGSRAGFRQGVGAEALFDSPEGLVLGPEGVLYVADTRNHSIRRVTRDGLVSLVAGRTTTQGKGYVNGPLASARFNHPAALAFGPDGTLYVADAGNHCVRLITPDGQVSTLTGAGPDLSPARDPRGLVDGPASEARFSNPRGIAVGPDGAVYVADTDNHRLRVVR